MKSLLLFITYSLIGFSPFNNNIKYNNSIKSESIKSENVASPLAGGFLYVYNYSNATIYRLRCGNNSYENLNLAPGESRYLGKLWLSPQYYTNIEASPNNNIKSVSLRQNYDPYSYPPGSTGTIMGSSNQAVDPPEDTFWYFTVNGYLVGYNWIIILPNEDY